MPRRWYLLPCRTLQPVVVTTAALPNGSQGTAYSFQYSANGGTPPYTWALVSDTGTNTWLVSSGGLLTGTPTAAEVDVITVRVTDSAGASALSAPLSLTVAASGGAYVFDHFASPTGSDLNPGTLASPWALTSINSKSGSFTQLGLIADQGPYVFATIGIPYVGTPTNFFGDPVLNAPSGTAVNPVVIAGCSSAGAFVGPSLKAVIDASCNNPPAFGWDPYWQGGGAILGSENTGNVIFDSLELKNGQGHAFLFDTAAQIPNVQIRNCLWHHIYNYNEGFAGTGSIADTNNPGVLTVTAISGGTVNDKAHAGPGAAAGDTIWNPANGNGFGSVMPYGTNGTTGTGLTGTYQLVALSTVTFTGNVTGQTSGTILSSSPGIPNYASFILKFSDGEIRQATKSGSVLSWSPAIVGPGSVTTCSAYPNLASQSITGSTMAGNNLSGCAIENITSSIVYNCFCYAIIDLNSAINNNKRSTGIKSFNCAGLTVDLCTVYADATSQQPVQGFATKDNPCYDISITRSFVHLANALTGSPEGHCIGGDLKEGTGRFATYTNNVLVHPNNAGLPLEGSGSGSGNHWSNMPITWASNTCVITSSAAASCLGFVRFSETVGALNVQHYNNIYYNVNGGTVGSNGTIESGGDVFNLLDYDVVPASSGNGQMYFQPVGGGTGVRYLLGTPAQLTTFQNSLSASTVGKEAHIEVGNGVILANASATLLKATDYQLAGGSLGKGTGSTNGLPSGSVTDKGAWGNGITQIGCQWMDPF